MKLSMTLFACLLFFLPFQTALAEDHLMRITDSDGFVNLREGPSASFPILSRVDDGDVVEVYFDPAKNDLDEAYADQVWVWDRKWNQIANHTDWVAVWRMDAVASERWPGSLLRAPVGLIHRSRLKPVNVESIATVFIEDSDGYSNLRTGPSSSHEICGQVRSNETAIALWDGLLSEKPEWGAGWLKDNLAKLKWVKVINKRGQTGYLHHSRIRVHDPRNAGILKSGYEDSK